MLVLNHPIAFNCLNHQILVFLYLSSDYCCINADLQITIDDLILCYIKFMFDIFIPLELVDVFDYSLNYYTRRTGKQRKEEV